MRTKDQPISVVIDLPLVIVEMYSTVEVTYLTFKRRPPEVIRL